MSCRIPFAQESRIQRNHKSHCYQWRGKTDATALTVIELVSQGLQKTVGIEMGR